MAELLGSTILGARHEPDVTAHKGSFTLTGRCFENCIHSTLLNHEYAIL